MNKFPRNNPNKSNMKPNKMTRTLTAASGLLALLTILTASTLPAATLYWTANGTTYGGSGLWDTNSARWTPDEFTSVVAWTNANNDTAAITNQVAPGTAGGFLNITDTIQLGGLRFENIADQPNSSVGSGWAFALHMVTNTGSLDFGAGGSTIYVDSGTNTPYMQVGQIGNLGQSNFISSDVLAADYPGSYVPSGYRWQGGGTYAPIVGSGTLTKDGPGTFYLESSNTYTGTLAINQGSVQLGRNVAANYNALQNITNITMADGTRLGAWSTNVDILPPITLSGGTVTISGNITPVGNGSQSSLYKKLFIKGGIRGTGNVVFRGVNMFAQYNQTILSTNCTYDGTTLLTCGNHDLFGLRGILGADNNGGSAGAFSQQNFNNQYALQLGIDNALPPTTVLTMDGEMGITWAASTFPLYNPANLYALWRQGRVLDFVLGGFNQTLAGLNNTNRFGRFQRVFNLNANAAATLTISNTADCTFSGSIGNVVLPGIATSIVGVQGLLKTTNHLDGNNLALVKAGPGTLTLMGPPLYDNPTNFTSYVNAYGNAYANGTTINGGTLLAANTVISWTNTYAGTVVNNASATGSGAVTVNSGGTLGGTGSIAGVVTLNAGGTLSPGIGGIGTLSLSNNVVMNAGSTNTFEVDGTTTANDQIALGATVTYGGVLKIVPSGSFTNGQTFTLFSGAGATSASQFSSIIGSPGGTNMFAFTNGVLSVVAAPTGPSGPGTITNSFNSGTSTLSLSWPAGQGWRLQGQTNSRSTGLGTNWAYVTDGSVSSTNITVDSTQPTVFYRLVYP